MYLDVFVKSHTTQAIRPTKKFSRYYAPDRNAVVFMVWGVTQGKSYIDNNNNDID